MIKKITSEPLVHFLLLGFLLYIYYSFTSINNQLQEKKNIKISSYELAQIKTDYKAEWGKDINEVSLDAYIIKKYYEKLLLSEAYSLGLEQQDKVISQRLLKQMYFIMLNSNELTEPTEDELHKYYMKHITDYSKVESLSFSHIFFENQKDKRISNILELVKIADINSTQATNFGDQFKFSNHINNISFNEVKIIYGNYFSLKLFKLQKNLWNKAIESKFGSHLIYVTDKNISQAYPFDDVEDRVYEDYMSEMRERKKDEAYQKIRTQYLFGSE